MILKNRFLFITAFYTRRMSATLPPEPTFNKNVPVISSAGGTADAYKDPKSPESIMRNTAMIEAQSSVNAKYDVNLEKEKKKEGFKGFKGFKGPKGPKTRRTMLQKIIMFFSLIALLFITLSNHRKNKNSFQILFLASVFLLITIYFIQNDNIRP